MILVLKDADFSANNIGQVDVDRELNAYTLAAIAASGNDSLTDTQKFALDDLFLAMGVDGSNQVMSKIRKLYLPMIAGSVGNALINYTTDDFVKDATPNDVNWELRNHGITQKASGQNLELTLNNPLVGTNYTQMWLRTENMVSGVNDTCYNMTLRGKSDISLFLGLIEQSAASNGLINYNNSNGISYVGTVYKSVEQRCVFGISYRAANDVSLQRFGEYTLKTDGSIGITTDMSEESSQTLYVLGLNSQQAPKPFGFMLLGEALSETDFKNIRDKVNALYAAISV